MYYTYVTRISVINCKLQLVETLFLFLFRLWKEDSGNYVVEFRLIFAFVLTVWDDL